MDRWLPIKDIASKVQSGELSATELVNQSLSTIKEKKDYNAIISTINDRALERAKDIDSEVRDGKKVGRLAGVPFVAKDNFLTYGSPTTAASHILENFQAPYQSTAIERLEAEGAICVAKSNLDAFGHGASTENSDFMITKNPHDKSRVPGGSSGGSAAAVVLGMVPFAIGTDTGGSIRLPSSLSGCVGYKPTYGLVSRSGVIAMASSTDTIGPLAMNVTDASIVLDIMAGKDSLDSTTIERDDKSYSDLAYNMKGKRIGVIKEYMGEGIDDEVKKQIKGALKKLQENGASISEISLPSLSLSLAAYYILVPAEISSNLSRYDGQRFGYSDKEAKNIEESYRKSRSKGFGNEAKRRIIIGTYVLSSGYYDAYYKKAQIVRTKIIDEFNEVFKKYDFLVGPVSPTTAFKIGTNTDPLQMYLVDVMTVAASLAGLPAVSIPINTGSGLPIGLQLLAPQRKDHELLKMAKAYEELI
jgi:aspartyl-tRNA(Asn)/glutamyl-tRNA(Gln) amidotransferase subunit A